MLSIFCSTEFSFKTPQNWAFFIWTFSLFFPPPSFIQQTRPDVSVHCRPGWRFVFIVIFFNILFIFFLLCFVCFSTFSTVKFFCPSVKLVSRFHTPAEKKKKERCDVFYLQEALNEMKALASPCYSSSEKSYLNTWDTSWIGHCLLGGFLGLMSLQYSHSLIHLNTAGHLMLATASTLLSFLRGRLLK